MNKKILVVALGGTIGSVKRDCIRLDKNNLKILDFCKRSDVELKGVSPFSLLSENMTAELLQRLIDFIDGVDKAEYLGIIILHGSDTLSFTSAVIANAFPDDNIVLTAADKPVEDKESNGIKNFDMALDHLLSGARGVYVAYNKIMKAITVTGPAPNDDFISVETNARPINSRKIRSKNILIITPYVNISLDNYDFSRVDAVLFTMYHSATVPKNIADFAKSADIPVYFVTHKPSADYETAEGIENILFSSTVENAYARLLLTD